MNQTLRYSLIYGGLGAIVLGLFIVVVGMLHERVAWVSTLAFGLSVMVVAMGFVFVGVKRYRDVECGGVVRFWPAFRLGLLIALVAALGYVLMWEVYLAATDYRFFDDYMAKMLRDAQASGQSASAIAAMSAEFDSMRTAYANPLYRLPLTFSEIAPIGLVVALLSAVLLRNPRLLPARA